MNEWKQKSLLDDQGIIWKDEPIWSNENLHKFRSAFIERPDESSGNFYIKLEGQLATEDESVHKYVLELLFIYFLIPKGTKFETKLNNLQMVADWKNIELDFEQPIYKALKNGLAHTGMAYNSRIYNEISLIHIFVEKLKRHTVEERKTILEQPTTLKNMIEQSRIETGRKVQMQHLLQHLLLPSYFEWIASWTDKEMVVSTFDYLIEDEQIDDIDEKIYYIKQKLKEEYNDDDIDFYHTPEIKEIWKPEKKKRYFWLNIAEKEYEKEEGITSSLYNEKGNRKREIAAYSKINVHDEVIFFEISPVQKVTAVGKVTDIKNVRGSKNKMIYFEVNLFFKDPIPWDDVKRYPDLRDSRIVKSNNNGSTLYELTETQYNAIVGSEYKVKDEEQQEMKIAEKQISPPAVSFDRELDPEKLDLVFEQEEILLNQINTALQSGDHIIFTGPPGTGKSKLAKQVCQMYDVDAKMVTASSNWSTYDTIGGYRPDRTGQLYFDPGIFLSAIKDTKTNEPKNEWVIVDEINRADIDKAFGSLFSVLTGDTVSLPFEAANGEKVELILQEEEKEIPLQDHTYVIPNDWRMIGTMNTIDKSSLFEMSYAFMRRFAFIPVRIPQHINETLVSQYITMWNIPNYPFIQELTDIWKLINQYRKIGPAIIRDIAQYTVLSHDFVSAIILYVLPQFEGLPE